MSEEKTLSIVEFAERAKISKQGIYQQAKSEGSRLHPYFVKEGGKLRIKAEALDLYIGKESQANQSSQAEVKQESQVVETSQQEVNQSSQAESKATEQESQPEEGPDRGEAVSETQADQQNQSDGAADSDEKGNGSDGYAAAYIHHLEQQIEQQEQNLVELRQTVKEKDKTIEEQSQELADLAHKLAMIAEKAIATTAGQQYLSAKSSGQEPIIQQQEAEPIESDEPVEAENSEQGRGVPQSEEQKSKPKKSFWKRIFGG